MQPPPLASSPPLELRLDFGTDIEITRRSREHKRPLPEEQKPREKSPAIGGKKSKDRSQQGYESSTQRSSPMPGEEEKGLLGGLLRFRTRSKERKAAAKQALQQVAEPYRSMTPPIRSNSTPPPPLPIALRFARQQDELSFRPPKVPESESSHGGATSVGHTDTSIGHQSATTQGSSEAPYPRPRDRSSRYERPHPVWRNGPTSTIGKNPTVPLDEAAVSVPQERHAYPPNQTIFDREPVKPSRVPISNNPSTPAIDMEAVNKYYGITPVTSNTPVATIPATPSPQSRFALAQALASTELRVPENPATPRLTPTTMAPASPSPYIVPSPDPTQEEFTVRKREKPGRMNKPPALDPVLVASRRKMALAHIPPPSPPPTMELPPIPTDFPPPSSSSLRPPFPSPLATARSPSPNMRMGSTGLSAPPPPYSERSATATPEVGVRSASPMYRPVSPPNPPRAASPIQRGKTPAFPIRPVTPTTRPMTPNREPQPQAHVKQTSPVATRSNQPFLLNRRPDYGVPEFARPRRSSLNEQDLAPLRGNLLAAETHQPVAIPRKRSLRRGNRQSGYDSDDAESRYSRDTYYGRDTAYFDDQNMPPLPGEPMPELPRDFGNLEQERKAGRERLLKFLSSRDS